MENWRRNQGYPWRSHSSYPEEQPKRCDRSFYFTEHQLTGLSFSEKEQYEKNIQRENDDPKITMCWIRVSSQDCLQQLVPLTSFFSNQISIYDLVTSISG